MHSLTKSTLSSCSKLLVLLVMAGIVWPAIIARPAYAAAASCDFAQMVSADVRVIEGRSRRQYTVPVTEDMQEALASLKGYGLWKDGENGAYGDFVTPGDIQTVAWITLKSDDGKTRWLWFAESPSKPGHAYAWVFTSLQSTTNSKGEHYGAHQMCATVDVPLEHVQVLFSSPETTTGVAMDGSAQQNS